MANFASVKRQFMPLPYVRKRNAYMERTFHYRVSWVNYIAVFIVVAAAVFFFLNRSAYNALVGLLLVVVVLMMTGRMIHTVYVLTSDGWLVVDKGRFSRPLSVPVSDITAVRRMCPPLLPVRFVVIEYGAGHVVSVQPFNEEEFVCEIECMLDGMKHKGMGDGREKIGEGNE